MNELQQVFNYEDSQVRVMMIDGDPWFVAKDVCDVLGIGNPSESLRRLDPDEGASVEMSHPQNPLKTIMINAVNEPGLYSLILKSRKPQAKAFDRWVRHEVLPAIRKTGSYSVQPQYQIPQTYLEALKAHVEAVERAEAAEQLLAIAAPKVEFHDRFMDADDAQTMEQVAKTLHNIKDGVDDDVLRYRVLHDNSSEDERSIPNIDHQGCPYGGHPQQLPSKCNPANN